jgi:hypothetical protein
LPAGRPNRRRGGVRRIPILEPCCFFSDRASHAQGGSHVYYCYLYEIEIAIEIEIEKVWGLDIDPDFDLDFDFDKTIFRRSSLPWPGFTFNNLKFNAIIL